MNILTPNLFAQASNELGKRIAEAELIIAEARIEHSAKVQCLKKWEQHAPALLEAFRKLGLELRNISMRSTTTIAFDAMPLAGSSKFRFIQFAGYAASGAGRNNNQLTRKTQAIKTILEEACAYSFEFNVNPYSLEAGAGVVTGTAIVFVSLFPHCLATRAPNG